MTRTAFLAALEQLLAPLPEAERKDALSYYEDYLDAAGPEKETQAIAELGSAAAVVIEVHRTHDGAVPHGLAQLGQSLVELVLIDLAQDLFAELLGHTLHLTADGGIVVGPVSYTHLTLPTT